MTSSGTIPYVPITRHFHEVSEDPKDGLTTRLLRNMGTGGPTTWQTLLRPYAGERAPSAVVLIAPSGAGKSTETLEEAKRLRLEGHVAFYCEAGAVATDGLRESLSPSGVREFDAWLSGTSSAVLFLDAIDEVYLRQRKFRDVTRTLANAIEFSEREVQVVVTVRSGAWSTADRDDLIELLRQGKGPAPVVKVLRFAPLDSTALAVLARSAGVDNLDAFLRRFDDDELYDLVDLRPCDVRLFVNYWNKHGSFGTWSQILGDFLDTIFVETNFIHQSRQAMSLEQASDALGRIAVASILTKKPHITLPTSNPITGAIDSRKLFADWEGRLLVELFGNALFVHKGEAAVQLPQGALTHFLAAKWFGERVRKGWSPEELQDALFVELFNERRRRAPGSRLPLIGWVASEVPALRKLLLEEAPHILLYEGDPRQLAPEEIIAALRKVVDRAAAKKGTPWPTRGTVRQLARPELADEILSLLREYRGNSDVESLLLPYAELGHYKSCLPRALEIALDREADLSSRVPAVSVVAAVGGPTEKGALLLLVAEGNDELATILIQTLVPEHLHGEPLVQFLLRVDDFKLRYYVARAIDRVSIEDVDATLRALVTGLDGSEVTEATKAHFELGVVLIMSRLRRRAAVEPWLGDAIVTVERHWEFNYVSRDHKAELARLFEHNPTARRAIWEARIKRAQDLKAEVAIVRPRLADLQPDDVAWLFEQRERVATESIKNELLRRIDRFYQSSPRPVRAAVRERADLQGELVKRFDDFDANENAADASRIAEDEVKRLKAEATRNDNIATLAPRKAALESGEDLGLLIWGWRRLGQPDTPRARMSLEQLRQLVGDDLMRSFDLGLKAYWRRGEVSLPEPGNSGTPLSVLAGLTGLTLEIRDGLSLPMLTPAEAELAARYGLHEHDAFPDWFDDLRAAHPTAVRKVLEEVLESEWLATCEHHGVMRFAPYAPREVGVLMHSIVLALAEARPAGHFKIVSVAADALLVSSEDGPRVAKLARRQVESWQTENDQGYQWLRVWAHLAPIEAAEWLENARTASTDQFNRLAAGVAVLLDRDFETRSRTVLTELGRPNALEKWVRVLHLAVRLKDETDTSGHDSFETRVDAGDFWRRCLNRLAEDPSLEAYTALRRLRADDAFLACADLLERLSDAQAELAAEAAAAPWSESEVIEVERQDERSPSSPNALFRLVLRHLSRVGQLVNDDDFGYRRLFRPDTSEKEIQLWAASSLKLIGGRLYSVVREPEVADDNKVDLCALVPNVGRIPIEIKPLGSYSLTELKDCISAQLYAKYMRPSDVKYGILLLVRHREKAWEIDGARQGFSALVRTVRNFAHAFGLEHDKVIEIATIDLLSASTEGS